MLRSGVVCEDMGHNSYLVRMDGSGRVSKRNRRFLRVIRPHQDILADLGKGRGRTWPPRDLKNAGDSGHDPQGEGKDAQVDLGIDQGCAGLPRDLKNAGDGSHVSQNQVVMAARVAQETLLTKTIEQGASQLRLNLGL